MQRPLPVLSLVLATVLLAALLASPSGTLATESVIDGRWLSFQGDGVYSLTLRDSKAPRKWTRLAKNHDKQGFRHPRLLATLDDSVLFALNDRSRGFELWRSDGTRRGTRLVADVRPGAKGAIQAGGTAAARVRDRVLIALNDGTHGQELWVSDGTRQGTRLVKDIRPGSIGSKPSQFVVHEDRAFFVASDGTHGRELWITDGTEAGTGLVMDMNPGPDDGGVAPGPTLNGRLLFSATGGANGRSGWSTDGTAAGTTRIPEMPFYDNSLSSCTLRVADRESYVHSSGRLWRTDGTGTGTSVISGPIPTFDAFGCRLGPGDAALAWEDVAYLGLFDDGEGVGRLWRTDGTTDGTFELAEFAGNVLTYTGLVVDGTLLFHANDGAWKLWATDGTVDGTRPFSDIHPDVEDVQLLTVVGDVAYLSADDGTYGRQIWATDGTPEGTVRLSEVEPRGFREVRHVATVDDIAFFTAKRRGQTGAPARSRNSELWRSDGSAAGTRMLARIE